MNREFGDHGPPNCARFEFAFRACTGADASRVRELRWIQLLQDPAQRRQSGRSDTRRPGLAQRFDE